MSRIENPSETFEKEDHRHLIEVRKLRRQAMFNPDLDELSKAVLGVTGSSELLNKYKKLYKDIEQVIGEPYLSIKLKNDELDSSTGGIIAGEPVIETYKYSAGSEYYEPDYVGFKLSVPTKLNISSRHWLRDKSYMGKISRAWNIKSEEVATVWSDESINLTSYPEEDYHELDHVRQGILLLGRAAIYQSEYLAKGAFKTLLAIEEQL